MSITEQLLTAINAAIESGRTPYSIATAAGLSPIAIDRFRRGERSLKIESAAKIASALGLELRPIKSRKKSFQKIVKTA